MSSPFASPLFFPLAPVLARLPAAPDPSALSALLAAAPIRTATGLPLRFVPPADDGLGYEERIALRGEVETRPANWHDWFNALVWLSFPRAKAALSARHAAVQAAARAVAVPRGSNRDALTHFDECGAVVVADDASLLDLLADFRWRELFVDRRRDVRHRLRVFIFGHATYESLRAPFRGLTAKCLLWRMPAGWLELPLTEQLAMIDGRLAAAFAAGLPDTPRALHPLPLLGIPGVVPESEFPAYYDDAWQFRCGRRPPP